MHEAEQHQPLVVFSFFFPPLSKANCVSPLECSKVKYCFNILQPRTSATVATAAPCGHQRPLPLRPCDGMAGRGVRSVIFISDESLGLAKGARRAVFAKKLRECVFVVVKPAASELGTGSSRVAACTEEAFMLICSAVQR